MLDAQPSTTFGRLLQEYRRRAGLTQEALAERAGLGRRSVQGLEVGANVPRRETIRRLVQALALSAHEQSIFEVAAQPAPRRRRGTAEFPNPSGALAGPRGDRTRRHNLPAQLTSFISREREVDEIKRLLSTSRLVTLTGTGGCGKTRLALEVARTLLDAYPDGVWLVELAALADPTLVPQTIAVVLGLREGSDQSIVTALTSYFRARRGLLLLDNCEHLIDACAQLTTTLLQSGPGLRILATSRQALGVAGEVQWRVPSLAAPDPSCLSLSAPDLPRIESRYAAIRLFVDRARAVQPTFALTGANVAAIAQICWQLDGIPLAIELAAARVSALPLKVLAERLDDRFRLLVQGNRASLPRQQTLRATIDWSYDLLTEPERALFRRLAVFAGGCTVEAAEAVCAGDGLAAGDALPLLAQVTDRSMVLLTEQGEEARYHLPETIRQYADERLAESGEAERVQERHAAYYLGLVADRVPSPEGFDRMEREHNNLRAALRWYLARGDAERAMRLGGALWGFWAIRGYLTEGRQHLATLLALPQSAVPPDVRAFVLAGAGRLAFNQSDFASAGEFYAQSLACWREAGDMRKVGQLLVAMGHLAREQGDFVKARVLFEESLAISRQTGSRRDLASALSRAGLLALQTGNYAEARAFLDEALRLEREVDDQFNIIWTTSRLGHVAHAQGDLVTARRLYAESLAALRQWNDRRGVANLLTNLGMLNVDEGDDSSACAHLRESAEILQELRDPAATAMLLDAFGGLAAAQGQPARAIRLAGAAAALRQAIGAPHARNLADWLERALRPARLALGDAAARRLWAEGQAMTREQAITDALSGE